MLRHAYSRFSDFVGILVFVLVKTNGKYPLSENFSNLSPFNEKKILFGKLNRFFTVKEDFLNSTGYKRTCIKCKSMKIFILLQVNRAFLPKNNS